MVAVSLAGRRFGKLLAIKYFDNVHRGKRSYRRYQCRCDCGAIKLVVGEDLTQGSTASCGCARRRFKEVAVRQVYQTYRSKAKSAQMDFSIDLEPFTVLVKQNCHYCGNPPTNQSHYRHLDETTLYNGLDRVDNLLGYTVNNVVPCCEICNKAKRAMPYEDFMEWIMRLVEHQAKDRFAYGRRVYGQ